MKPDRDNDARERESAKKRVHRAEHVAELTTILGVSTRRIPWRPKVQDENARTLTNLYNERPTWLHHAHTALGAAVAKAYRWDDYTPEMGDDEILRRLLTLNVKRSSQYTDGNVQAA